MDDLKYGEVWEHEDQRVMVIAPDGEDIDEEHGWVRCVVLAPVKGNWYKPGYVGSWDAFGSHWKRVQDAR